MSGNNDIIMVWVLIAVPSGPLAALGAGRNASPHCQNVGLMVVLGASYEMFGALKDKPIVVQTISDS